MSAKLKIVDDAAIPGMVLPDLAKWVCEESAVMTDERSPFHGGLVEGDPRVLLITGENASGKSLVFRLVAQLAGGHGVEAMTLSIRERTGGGTFEMAHMRRAMIFGEEETSSTGAVSARVVAAGFHNLSNRGPAILGLDEPELGLSDGYAEALGEYIGTSAAAMTGNACGVMVVTHSRRLAQGLVRGLSAEPTMIAMLRNEDDVAPSVTEWIAGRDERSVEDLLGLQDLALERFRATHRMLTDKD